MKAKCFSYYGRTHAVANEFMCAEYVSLITKCGQRFKYVPPVLDAPPIEPRDFTPVLVFAFEVPSCVVCAREVAEAHIVKSERIAGLREALVIIANGTRGSLVQQINDRISELEKELGPE